MYVPSSGSNREKRGATAILARLWPDARIPYTISSRYTSKFIANIMEPIMNDTFLSFVS